MTARNSSSSDLKEKEWFIIVENRQEGPYSLYDLKKDHRFTPDTLVWKKGFHEWKAARFIPEMRDIFKDDPEPQALHDPQKEINLTSDIGQEQATLTMQQDPYQLFLWILIVLLILFYTLYLTYK